MSDFAELSAGLKSALGSIESFASLDFADVELTKLQALPHSEVVRLSLRSADLSLIAKRAGPADSLDLAGRERCFYREVAGKLAPGLAPRCYVAEAGESGWLIIEDLKTTHRAITDPSRVNNKHCLQLVDTLARLHNQSEQAPHQQVRWSDLSSRWPGSTIEQRAVFGERALAEFLNALPPGYESRRRLLESIAGIAHEMSTTASNAGLIHGDAHFGNALFEENGTAILIDWAMPAIGIGEIDLAHVIALNLSPSQQSRFAKPMTEHYVRQRTEGSSLFSPVEFVTRFDAAKRFAALNPIIWRASGLATEVWKPPLDNALVCIAETTQR